MTLSQVDVIMSQRGRYLPTAGQLESLQYHFKRILKSLILMLGHRLTGMPSV